MNKKNEDEILVKEFLSGKEESFDKLYRKYSKKIYSFIRRIAGDEHLAEDFLQEVFMKVYKNLNKFKFKSSFYTWLYRIAFNTTITLLNKKKKRKETNLENHQNIKENHNTPDKILSESIIKDRISDAVGRLPEMQRYVFTLRFNEHMHYKDISKVLNISESSGKTNFHHALNNLKKSLGDLLWKN